jgi:hypothetical protein
MEKNIFSPRPFFKVKVITFKTSFYSYNNRFFLVAGGVGDPGLCAQYRLINTLP